MEGLNSKQNTYIMRCPHCNEKLKPRLKILYKPSKGIICPNCGNEIYMSDIKFVLSLVPMFFGINYVFISLTKTLFRRVVVFLLGLTLAFLITLLLPLKKKRI